MSVNQGKTDLIGDGGGAAAGPVGPHGEASHVGQIGDASQVNIEKLGTPAIDDVQDAIRLGGGAGATGSGYITDAGGGSIDIAAGAGFIRDTASHTGDLKSFEWSALAGQAIPADTVRHVGIDYNAGSPQVLIQAADSWNWTTTFRLGSVVNEGGTLHIVNNPQRAADAITLAYERFYETEPIRRADRLGGLILGETGTRNLTVSAGEFYDGLNEFYQAAKDTSGADTFDYYYRATPSGFTKVAAQTQWDNTQYDDGSGTLQNLGVNNFGIVWVYLELDNSLVALYGQGNYNTQAAAENAPPPSTVPLRLQVHGKLIGRLIFQESQATAAAIESVFTVDLNPAQVTSHTELADIGTNTHPAIDAHIAAAVFGKDYQRQESLAESQTTLAAYQDKVTLTTPALTGTYRIAWGAMVTNTDKVGQVRLYNSTDAAVVGAEIPYRPKVATDNYPTRGAVHEVTFTGAAKTFIVQWKDGAGGNTQSIKDAWIEVWRVS